VQELIKVDFDIVFDDDGTGEFADVISIRVRETVVEVLLCHCKYASTDTGAARLDDVCEVAGQALKSVQFCQAQALHSQHDQSGAAPPGAGRVDTLRAWDPVGTSAALFQMGPISI
jgi:hypothetical protein